MPSRRRRKVVKSLGPMKSRTPLTSGEVRGEVGGQGRVDVCAGGGGREGGEVSAGGGAGEQEAVPVEVP